MKCCNCGFELNENAKFCSCCGEKIQPQEVVQNDNPTSQPIWESAISPESSPNTAKQKSFVDEIKEKGSLFLGEYVAFWNKLSIEGKITVAALAVLAILCFVAFLLGKVFSGIIAMTAASLVVVGLLMRKGVIETSKSWIGLVAFALAFVLIIPYFGTFGGGCNGGSADGTKLTWSNFLLNEVLPPPKSNIGKIIVNNEDNLSVYIHKTSNDDFYNYISACREKGFIVESEQLTSSYHAYNEDGYKLSISYTASSKKMHIAVDAPVHYGNFEWTVTGLGNLLPVPESTTGEITSDDEHCFSATVAETSVDDYNTYVKLCVDKGFSVESTKSDKSYFAKNAEGYKLNVSYAGNNVMSVSVLEPEYEVNIEVVCVENWIFSKYNVEVYIDDDFEGVLAHGSTETYSVTLTKGVYAVQFVSAEDDELTGEVNINVSKDEDFKFKVSCSSFGIDVETVEGTISNEDANVTGETEPTEIVKITMVVDSASYVGKQRADVEKELKNMGFTNIIIREEKTKDVNNPDGQVTSVMAVDNSFKEGDEFAVNDEIIICCWKYDKPISEYEKAYIRDMSNYDLYYMFDIDTKTVVYFGTNDTYIEKGTYTGDFETGVTITWSHGEWTEKFTHKSGSFATVIDGNGWDWEYKVCDVGKAQKVLDGIQ